MSVQRAGAARLSKSLFIAAGVVLLAATPTSAANLLTNASFEGPPADNFAAGYYRGVQAPSGWFRISGIEGPDILSNTYVQTGSGFQSLLTAQDGVRFLDMNGASPTGALYQNVTGLTSPGSVTLSYWVGRWAQNSAGNLTASLIDTANQNVLASQVTTLAHLPRATSASWTLYTLTAAVPISGGVRVQFTGDSGSTARGAPGLDNVSLDFVPATGAVPEPATWAMMISGFGMAGSMIRRRRARAV